MEVICMKPIIIILHRDKMVVDFLAETLRVAGIGAEQILGTSDKEKVFTALKDREDCQMLIMGSFETNDTEGVEEFIEAAKKHNPKLVAVMYSSILLPGRFDATIETADIGAKNVKQAIFDFLCGSLKQSAKGETPRRYPATPKD